jgi:intergrase/recombinase
VKRNSFVKYFFIEKNVYLLIKFQKMSVIEIKSNIHHLIEQVQDNDFLVKIEGILANFVADKPIIWSSLHNELKQKLENAEKDSAEGRTSPHEEVVKKFRQRYAHLYES